MSREFGEGSTFFHNKIRDAHEDALSGGSRGAKVLAQFLEPLAEIAYDVSGEEAGDSSESSVIGCCHIVYGKLQNAMYALSGFLDPSIELAAKALSQVLKYEIIEQTKPGELGINVWRGNTDSVRYDDILNRALLMIARKHKNGLWHRTSCGGSMNSDYVTYYFSDYNSEKQAMYLFQQIDELKKRVAYLEAIVPNSETVV